MKSGNGVIKAFQNTADCNQSIDTTKRNDTTKPSNANITNTEDRDEAKLRYDKGYVDYAERLPPDRHKNNLERLLRTKSPAIGPMRTEPHNNNRNPVDNIPHNTRRLSIMIPPGGHSRQ